MRLDRAWRTHPAPSTRSGQALRGTPFDWAQDRPPKRGFSTPSPLEGEGRGEGIRKNG